jgi:hypothetical protein
MPIKNKFVPIFLLLLLGASVGIAEQSNASAVLTKKQAKALEATASTPQDHLNLSAYYRAEARKFEREVRYHEEMAEIYRKNPLPFDGKVAVPMQRHCKDWASYFAQKAERATVLATFHEQKAAGSNLTTNVFAQPSLWGLRSSGFNGTNISSVTTQATREQSSLFLDSVAASVRFYDLTRILTYFVSANGGPSIEMPKLKKSAAALFDTQQRFLQSLTEPQKTATDAHLRTIEKLRRDIENGLERLGNGRAFPAGGSYFKTAKKMKGSIESWYNEQQEIALQLEIQS